MYLLSIVSVTNYFFCYVEVFILMKVYYDFFLSFVFIFLFKKTLFIYV